MAKAPFYVRPLAKKGKSLAKKPKAASGFDYPTQLVGASKWKGSDNQPVNIYYDPSTGGSGQSVAAYILSKIDDLMSSCDAWFGVKGQGGNVIVAPDFGGAYHYGCDFSNGGDWYESLSGNDTTLGLVMAEVTESYMGLQSKGWNCGGSGGEALSRFLAEVATGGAGGAMTDYSAGPSWDGADWISRDQGSDQDYPSIGCGVLYLWWLVSQGFTVDQIVQAGEPDGTLSTNYAKLTGKSSSNAFADFKAAVGKVGGPGGFNNDNPFNAANPPYPEGGSNPPPPPPPPPPAPPATQGIEVFQDISIGSYVLVNAETRNKINDLLAQIAAELPSDSLVVIPDNLRRQMAVKQINVGKLFQILALILGAVSSGPLTPGAILALVQQIAAILSSP